MTDEKNMEPVERASGDAQANAQTSGADSSGASSVSREILAALDEIVERKLQSMKDKRFAKLEGAQDDFQRRLQRLEELKEKGLSHDAAMEFMRLEDQVNDTKQRGEPPKADDASPRQAEPSVNQIDPGLLQQLGLDPSDATVAAALSDVSDGRKVLENLARLLNRPKPTPAQQMPIAAGAPAHESRESLERELMELIREPSKNEARIREINKKLSSLQT